MKVSIITAVFNRESTIGDAMRSVQTQTHPDIEHIVVDGASTDSSLDRIRDHADNRTRIVSEPDDGIYDALNKGIHLASGDVIGLMHSDDFYASSRVIEYVVGAFQEDGVDGVYGDLEYVSGNNPDHVIRYWSAGAYSVERLKWGWMPPHPTLYLRRAVIEQYGAYNTEYRIAADYEAMLRWLLQGRIDLAYVPRVFVRMRVGGASNSSVKQIVRKSLEDYKALRENRGGGVWTLLMKNLRKVKQFFVRG